MSESFKLKCSNCDKEIKPLECWGLLADEENYFKPYNFCNLNCLKEWIIKE